MNSIQFLEYLHEHPATTGLAEELAQIFVLRGRIAPAPAAILGAPRSVAS